MQSNRRTLCMTDGESVFVFSLENRVKDVKSEFDFTALDDEIIDFWYCESKDHMYVLTYNGYIAHIDKNRILKITDISEFFGKKYFLIEFFKRKKCWILRNNFYRGFKFLLRIRGT